MVSSVANAKKNDSMDSEFLFLLSFRWQRHELFLDRMIREKSDVEKFCMLNKVLCTTKSIKENEKLIFVMFQCF